jgi:hypothetical protein
MYSVRQRRSKLRSLADNADNRTMAVGQNAATISRKRHWQSRSSRIFLANTSTVISGRYEQYYLNSAPSEKWLSHSTT